MTINYLIFENGKLRRLEKLCSDDYVNLFFNSPKIKPFVFVSETGKVVAHTPETNTHLESFIFFTNDKEESERTEYIFSR